MVVGFSDIPKPVVDYIRSVFAMANSKVSRALTRHPAMPETTLDHTLISELSATPPAFFARQKIAVGIESHWLGSRHMWRSWEIADIAFFITLSRRGRSVRQKVALVQTKRLYSREIPVAELDIDDYRIGVGRIIDRPDPQFPLSTQRAFRFDENCVYGAINARGEQPRRIDDYIAERRIPVYYGLYNPVVLPYTDRYPAAPNKPLRRRNLIGFRIVPSSDLHSVLSRLGARASPRFNDLRLSAPLDAVDNRSQFGWRLERFIADEVLSCKQGRRFEKNTDPQLRSLLYERSGPMSAAINITIDFGDT